MNLKNKGTKGITLIALVITIIVLLILAGISIATLSGDNGILTQAKNAKEATIIAEEKEAIEQAYVKCQKDNMDTVSSENMQKKLKELGYNTNVQGTNDLQITFIDTNHLYGIEQDGNIFTAEELENKRIVNGGISRDFVYAITAKDKLYIQRSIYNEWTKFDINKSDSFEIDGGIKKVDLFYNTIEILSNSGNIYEYNDGELFCFNTYDSSILKNKKITDIDGILALDEDGKVYDFIDENICLNDVEGSLLKGKKVSKLYYNGSLGYMIDNEGKLYGYGINYKGELGDGTTEGKSVPICISDVSGSSLQGKTIVDIKIFDNNGTNICAIDSNGKTHVWGANYNRSLGIGTTTSQLIPVCINDIEGSLLKDKKISKINLDDSYILDMDGKVYTWGYNLGAGELRDSDIPVCISDIQGNPLQNKKIIDIVGYMYAIDTDGRVYSWGYNNKNGILGNGTNSDAYTPICISDLAGSSLNNRKVIKILPNIANSAIWAIDDEGKIHKWGCDEYEVSNDPTFSSIPICLSDKKISIFYGKEFEYNDWDAIITKNGEMYYYYSQVNM